MKFSKYSYNDMNEILTNQGAVMIKRTFKAIGILLIFGLSLSSLYLVNLFFMKPVSIDHFLGKEFLTGLADSPESMTYIGIFDQFNWITRHNSKLSILNPNDLQTNIKDAKKTLKILNKYKDSSLSDNQKITRRLPFLILKIT